MNKLKHIGIAANTAEGAALCYKTIVVEAGKVLGKSIHPEISLHSYSLNIYDQKEDIKDWDGLAVIVNSSIEKLALTGADFIIMPSNHPHYAIKQIQSLSSLPVLSIVAITVAECQEKGYKTVGILGIANTMSGGLYETPLKEAGLTPVVPTKKEQRS